jgi:putative transposase
VSPMDRQECLKLVDEASGAGARKEKACELIGVSLRTLERWEQHPEDRRKGPKTKPSNSLTVQERAQVLGIANSPEYASLPPWQIVPRLADQGIYVASESSFYRILKAENLLTHRLKSQPQRHAKPDELTATRPNEIWSWDITYLRTSVKGMFYYLYLPMDIFSRLIVHWEVHESEGAELASQMIETACFKQGIGRHQITLHADNGSPMKGATMLATLQRLGVAPSFSRPRVSDDNPFSESLFKTLKYCPSFPEHGFGSIEEARLWVEKFVRWYNTEHLHSAINWVTPESRHYGLDQAILEKRHGVYEAARLENPHRWSQHTRNWSRPSVVELNPRREHKQQKSKSHQQAS